jgi:hypothetical protein
MASRPAYNRVLNIKDGKVTFRWKDYRHHDQPKIMTLEAEEFIRRFLLHVLPDSFMRIRHYGFLGNHHRRVKIARCRELLAVAPATPSPRSHAPIIGTGTRN